MSKQEVLISYLRMRRGTIGFFGTCIVLFVAIFFLYALPAEPLLYAIVLCLSVGLLAMSRDMLSFIRQHQVLQSLKQSLVLDVASFPRPQSLLEKDYQELITLLEESERKATASAEQSRRELMEYYTLWAHQIKTPISAMRLVLQSQDEADSGELLAELFKIEQYADLVLQYLRIESPSTDFVLKRQSLDPIVRQVLHRYAKLFIRQKISLDFQELACEVLTDEKWLAFAIGQVLSNALKYTRQGMISIYLEDQEKKVLVIQDTGIGIAAEDLPRVFEQGFTGYTGRIEKKATGIGLYLCKRVLDKLSHTISIESEVGKGTKVKIGLDTVELFDPYGNVRLSGEV